MKNVLITGAAGNLGKAVVQKFLNSGYGVIVTAENEEQAKSFPSDQNLSAHTVDLMNEKEAADFIQSIISTHKKIDAAMLLVGGFAMGDIAATSGDDLKKQFTLNFETAYFIARPLFTHMMSNTYGRLIFVGARPVLDAIAGKNMIAYALSKSLLFKLAEFLNAAAKGKNVTACVFVPSTIDTPLNRKHTPDANPENWVKAEEIADAMEFVCSEKGMALREPVFKMYANA